LKAPRRGARGHAAIPPTVTDVERLETPQHENRGPAVQPRARRAGGDPPVRVRVLSHPRDVIEGDLREIVARLGPDVERLAGKTVLITGAAGMLPSYVADTIAHLNDNHLLSAPARLLLNARALDSNDGRISHLARRADTRFLVQDVRAPLALGEPVHFVVHAASAASPRSYRADPVGTLDVNSTALRQLLDATRSTCESFLYFSSSEVYGDPEPEHIPTPEAYVGRTPFLGGRACYTEAKRFGEALCAAYREQYGVPVKIVRPFHVHGPGLRLNDGRIVAALVEMGLSGAPFVLNSDGRATRTYGYVSDATVGFLSVLLSEHDGEAFNVGADEPETSILELATVVSRLFGRKEAVGLNAAPSSEHSKGAPVRVRPDLAKIRRLLGYAPSVSLEEGLRRTITWHQLRSSSSPLPGSRA
jgi:dTDP-glucose 4,6-dehydratase/UDP-glucuronate decarboxylase